MSEKIKNYIELKHIEKSFGNFHASILPESRLFRAFQYDTGTVECQSVSFVKAPEYFPRPPVVREW